MVLVFLADGFEETEAICPIDIMRRAGLDVVTVSINEERTVTGSHEISIEADITAETLPDCAPEMIVLPGGPGTKKLDANIHVHNYITRTAENGDYIAAICAAPSILGKMGLLKGKNATCFPGYEDKLEGAVIGGRVVLDGKIITACGMGAALEFGLEIVSVLCGAEKAASIKKAVLSR